MTAIKNISAVLVLWLLCYVAFYLLRAWFSHVLGPADTFQLIFFGSITYYIFKDVSWRRK